MYCKPTTVLDRFTNSNVQQVYNPGTGQWQSSANLGNKLQPLPAARGGMGKAVYFNGEFYIMGGETTIGPSTALGVTPSMLLFYVIIRHIACKD